MSSPGFVHSFFDKQLKTSIRVSQRGRGRKILGRGLWLESLKNYNSEFLFCLPTQGPEKWIKLQDIMQVKMLDLAQKTNWQSLQNSLHFHNIVSTKKMIYVVTMLTNKSWWCGNNNNTSSSSSSSSSFFFPLFLFFIFHHHSPPSSQPFPYSLSSDLLSHFSISCPNLRLEKQ